MFDANRHTAGYAERASAGTAVPARSGNPNLDLLHANPIYPITMSDRRPHYERDWLDAVWAVVVLLGILFFRHLTGR